MLPQQERFFYPRTKQKAHADTILSAHAGTTPEHVFRQLIERVFSHHIVNFPFPREPKWPTQYGPDDLPPVDCICHLFHMEHWEDIAVTQGFDGANIPLDRFLAALTQNTPGEQLNDVRFLIGEVGSGKSSFISHLVVRYGWKWISGQKVVPIRVGIEDRMEHTVPTKQEFLFLLYEEIRKAFNVLGLVDPKTADKVYLETAISKTEPTGMCEEKLTGLIRRLSALSGKRILLIIDNLDYIYHVYDRGMFARQAGNDQLTPEQKELADDREKAQRLIKYIIRVFMDRSALGEAGMNVLVVIRIDSLEHYTRTSRPTVPLPYDPRMHTYELHTASLDDVLAAHGSLLEAVIKRLPTSTRTDGFMKAAKELGVALKPEGRPAKKRLREDLRELTRQGLRQIVEHHKQFVWIPVVIDEKCEIVERFQEQYSPSILAFLTNGNKLFTQFRSEFPNLYLVRSDCYEETLPAWARNLMLPHRHTYWLKRLMIEYITHEQNRAAQVTPNRVYNIFSEEQGDSYCYEDWIVRLCLGSLAQVDRCHVLDFEFAPSETDQSSTVVEEIRLTRRGRKLAGGFMDTFTYLQLIVDDFLLPIPACVEEYFTFGKQDYGYLVETQDLYSKKVADMVRHKIRQVYVFIEVLRASLEIEQREFATVFARLAERGVKSPSVEAIEDRVTNDLKVILNYFPTVKIEESMPDRTKVRGKLVAELTEMYNAGHDRWNLGSQK